MVAPRPGFLLLTVATVSAQLAQWAPSRVLTVLASPKSPRFNGSDDC